MALPAPRRRFAGDPEKTRPSQLFVFPLFADPPGRLNGRARLREGPGFFVWRGCQHPGGSDAFIAMLATRYIGENEPIVPLVGPEALPVIVLFPRLSKVPAFTRWTPKAPLFENTQYE